jgi:protein-disulfide isomerase
MAAECARTQGRFDAMSRLLFTTPDSLWIGSLGALAARAGVPDSTALVDCVSSNAHESRIEAGLALGRRLGVDATPTVVIEGHRFRVPPSGEQLLDFARRMR